MHVALFPQPFPSSMAKIDAVEMKLHSKVRLFTEMVETLMAFLRLFIAIELRGTNQWDRVHKIITGLLLKCRALTPEFSKFSVESEMMKIAVHGDHSALSTLYFFQVCLIFHLEKCFRCLFRCLCITLLIECIFGRRRVIWLWGGKGTSIVIKRVKHTKG